MVEQDRQQTYLSIYLRDHLASAVAGIELARRLQAREQAGAFGASMSELLEELVEDREVLEGLMEQLEVEPSEFKKAAAWLGEKVSRLKLNGRLVSRSPLSTVVELEGLAMGVSGKRSLWESMQASPVSEQYEAFDFPALVERAEGQLERLRELHARAARSVFTEGASAAEAGSRAG